jgi:hypothetical protein
LPAQQKSKGVHVKRQALFSYKRVCEQTHVCVCAYVRAHVRESVSVCVYVRGA